MKDQLNWEEFRGDLRAPWFLYCRREETGLVEYYRLGDYGCDLRIEIPWRIWDDADAARKDPLESWYHTDPITGEHASESVAFWIGQYCPEDGSFRVTDAEIALKRFPRLDLENQPEAADVLMFIEWRDVVAAGDFEVALELYTELGARYVRRNLRQSEPGADSFVDVIVLPVAALYLRDGAKPSRAETVPMIRHGCLPGQATVWRSTSSLDRTWTTKFWKDQLAKQGRAAFLIWKSLNKVLWSRDVKIWDFYFEADTRSLVLLTTSRHGWDRCEPCWQRWELPNPAIYEAFWEVLIH